MGIHDRDYYRRPPRPDHFRGLRRLSFNAWLIIINVAVFIVSNLVLSDAGPLKRLFIPNLSVDTTVDFGHAYRTDIPVSEDDRRLGVINKNIRMPLPTLPGDAYGNPIYDAKRIDTDGRPLLIGFKREGFLPPLYAFGHFSTAKAFGWEVWRFLTFQFLHASPTHLIFNMFGLWFVGGLVEQYLGSRRYAVFYLLSGAAGGLMYLILNLMGNVFGIQLPGVLFNDVYTPLIGASAGVFAVLIAAAYIQPHAIVQVYFLIPMRLRTAVYGLMAITLVNLLMGSRNAGGEAAHVGGALAGFYLIRRPHILRTIFGFFGSRDVPSSRRGAFAWADSGWGARSASSARRPAPGSAPHSSASSSAGTDDPAIDWSVVNRVVEKARTQGIDSLSPGEKRLLAKVRDSIDQA